MTTIWNDVFITGKIKDGTTNKELCSIVLCGWSTCCLSKAPDKFGYGMAAISERLKIPATEKHIIKYAKQEGWL